MGDVLRSRDREGAVESKERQITGDDIVSELVRNLELGLFKIRYTSIAPAIYQVYLHAADYEAIKPVIPALQAEARRALQEKLDDLTNKSKPSALARTLGLAADQQVEYKILDPDWTIQFYPDHEDKLLRGDIEIYSDLASAPRPEYGGGAMTRRITHRGASGESTTRQERATPAPDPPASGAHAVIRFRDAAGERTYPVTENQIVIGRGGKSFWVDLKLDAPPDVSREHCRIRRDPATGKFFIKDVSQFGTSVDGKRLPSSLDGESRDQNVEAPLPSKCVISLADVVSLDFEVTPRS